MERRTLQPVTWWKQLSDHLHQSTDQRLRQLQIHNRFGRVTVQATAPSMQVRDLAEAAAREVVPEYCLSLAIQVTGRAAESSEEFEKAKRKQVRETSQIDAEAAILKRFQSLVTGN